MKYYRIERNRESKFIAIPSDEWMTPCYLFAFGIVTDRDLLYKGEYVSPNADAIEELSQATYRAITGGVEKADFYEEGVLYEGEMPDDWETLAQQVLLPDYRDEFGNSNDYSMVVNDEVAESSCAFWEMLNLCQGIDPEIYADGYDRWLYGKALQVIKERGCLLVRGEEATKHYVECWDESSEVPLSDILSGDYQLRIFALECERDAYKQGVRDAVGYLECEFVDVDYLC